MFEVAGAWERGNQFRDRQGLDEKTSLDDLP